MVAHLLALFFSRFAFICTEKKFPIEELDGDNSKDELEKDVDDENVYYIF